MICQIRDLLDDSESTESGLDILFISYMQYLDRGTVLTFFRIYVLLDPSSFSISFAKSRDISSDAISAKVQRARPTAYMFVWFMSLAR